MSGFEIVGLVLATPGFIQILFELKDANQLVAYLSDFGVDSSRATLQLQLEIGQSICKDVNVDDGVKDYLDKTFIEIQRTLNTASDQNNSTLAASKKLRKYFVEREHRQSLEASVRRLKELTKTFGDTIDLVRTERASPSAIFLSKNVFQVFEKPNVDIADKISLRHGQLSSNVGRISPQNGPFILERRPYSQGSKEELEDNIKYLTKILAASSHSEGILDIVGYSNDAEAECFNLVFAMPEHLAFKETLQNRLCKTVQVPPLGMRVSVCGQLADSVFHVHRLGLVHKNISSANVAVMESTDEANGSEGYKGLSIFLLNWHLVRRASDATNRAGETSWWKGIYCHPKRQMEIAQEEYSMGHDIYSLGVCMLELLTWKALVEYTDGRPVLSSIFRDRATRLGVLEKNRVALRDRGRKTESELCTADPFAVQTILEDLARTELPAIAGSKLSKLVVSCLSCLEGGFPYLSFDQKSQIEIGMNFMVSVKAALAQISI